MAPSRDDIAGQGYTIKYPSSSHQMADHKIDKKLSSFFEHLMDRAADLLEEYEVFW
jgi:hypothetical protein